MRLLARLVRPGLVAAVGAAAMTEAAEAVEPEAACEAGCGVRAEAEGGDAFHEARAATAKGEASLRAA
jgi:hypothetical protein